MSALPLDLSKYREVVVLTGAGLSAASGLPTYRGAGGLWESANVAELATAAAVQAAPERVWDFFAEIRTRIAEVSPNAGHHALAAAEARKAASRPSATTQSCG